MGVEVTIYPDGSLQDSVTPEVLYKRLQALEHQMVLLQERAISIEGKIDKLLNERPLDHIRGWRMPPDGWPVA